MDTLYTPNKYNFPFAVQLQYKQNWKGVLIEVPKNSESVYATSRAITSEW